MNEERLTHIIRGRRTEKQRTTETAIVRVVATSVSKPGQCLGSNSAARRRQMNGSYHLLESERNLGIWGVAVNPLFCAISAGPPAQFPHDRGAPETETAKMRPPPRTILS